MKAEKLFLSLAISITKAIARKFQKYFVILHQVYESFYKCWKAAQIALAGRIVCPPLI